MKKNILFGTLVASCFLLSGCGNKTLSCTKTESDNGYFASQTIDAKFVGNEVTNISLNMKMTLDEEIKDNIDLLISSLEEEFEIYQNKEGLKFEINSNNDTEIDVTMDADLKKMSDDDKDELNLVGTRGNYDATKKELEDEGYTCK